MSQGPIVAPMPIMLKHPILARIDEISRDPGKVAAMRDLLKSDCDARALADVAVRNGICPPALADYMLRYWANVDGAGWLGEIMPELRSGALATCEALLDGAPPLSSWWIIGLTQEFRILVVPTDEQLLLLMTTPNLPEVIRASKLSPTAIDQEFRPLIQVLRNQLDELLAPPAATPPAA